MKEVKPPKKPLIYCYTVVLLSVLLFNFLAMAAVLYQLLREDIHKGAANQY